MFGTGLFVYSYSTALNIRVYQRLKVASGIIRLPVYLQSIMAAMKSSWYTTSFHSVQKYPLLLKSSNLQHYQLFSLYMRVFNSFYACQLPQVLIQEIFNMSPNSPYNTTCLGSRESSFCSLLQQRTDANTMLWPLLRWAI